MYFIIKEVLGSIDNSINVKVLAIEPIIWEL